MLESYKNENMKSVYSSAEIYKESAIKAKYYPGIVWLRRKNEYTKTEFDNIRVCKEKEIS